MKINSNLRKLIHQNNFTNIGKIVLKYKEKNPDARIISLGVGDVYKPIVKPIIEAMQKAVTELAITETFKGYGPTHGYDFLKKKILTNEYEDFEFSLDEIYISNGTKNDTTNILELFSPKAKILITDPMYPIYRDGALAMSRKVSVLYLTEANDFTPKPPKEKYDVIYLCSPSNPIGNALTYTDLEKWIDYAIKHKAVILYDNVYHSFINSKNTPKSIYEIKNAKKVAIEFRSFSKNASFSGVRCSYYVIPNDLYPSINTLWKERTINRFNGADYIAQRGAEAYYSKEAQELIKPNIKEYQKNAKLLKNTFEKLKFKVWGGIDCPFLWIKTKDNESSWDLFYNYLEKINIVIIPGVIFGESGEGYFRVSALGKTTEIEEAINRLKSYYEKKA